jgi:hypothetical protein
MIHAAENKIQTRSNPRRQFTCMALFVSSSDSRRGIPKRVIATFPERRCSEYIACPAAFLPATNAGLRTPFRHCLILARRMTPKRLSRGGTIGQTGHHRKSSHRHNRESPMSRAMRTTSVRHAVLGLAIAGLAMCSPSTAKAGDFDTPAYGPYPYAAPVERNGICRILHERRVDVYGRETIHRIRICDEGPIYPGPSWSAAPQEYGYPRRRYFEPYSSGYYSPPRPPAPIGPMYYN